MRKLVCTVMLFIELSTGNLASAQAIQGAGDYMTTVSEAQNEMNRQYLLYILAACGSLKVKQYDNLRERALYAIKDARNSVLAMPDFLEDTSLKNASVKYMVTCYQIFHDDYAAIGDRELTARNSIKDMESFLGAVETANIKLQNAFEGYINAEKAFAENNTVKLITSKDESYDKIKKAGRIGMYHDKVFLWFFRCNWMDSDIFREMKEKKPDSAEIQRQALLAMTDKAWASLKSDELVSFEGNGALAKSCRDVIEFYQGLARVDIPRLIAFARVQEKVKTLKAVVEAKGDAKTNRDIDDYNQAVRDANSMLPMINALTKEVNQRRAEQMQKWEQADAAFMEKR